MKLLNEKLVLEINRAEGSTRTLMYQGIEI